MTKTTGETGMRTGLLGAKKCEDGTYMWDVFLQQVGDEFRVMKSERLSGSWSTNLNVENSELYMAAGVKTENRRELEEIVVDFGGGLGVVGILMTGRQENSVLRAHHFDGETEQKVMLMTVTSKISGNMVGHDIPKISSNWVPENQEDLDKVVGTDSVQEELQKEFYGIVRLLDVLKGQEESGDESRG